MIQQSPDSETTSSQFTLEILIKRDANHDLKQQYKVRLKHLLLIRLHISKYTHNKLTFSKAILQPPELNVHKCHFVFKSPCAHNFTANKPVLFSYMNCVHPTNFLLVGKFNTEIKALELWHGQNNDYLERAHMHTHNRK